MTVIKTSTEVVTEASKIAKNKTVEATGDIIGK